MTAVTPVVKPVSQMQLAPGSAITIPNVSWQEFESILQELGEKRSARIAYSKNTLDCLLPSYTYAALFHSSSQIFSLSYLARYCKNAKQTKRRHHSTHWCN
jgi:hypothetical protein